MDPQLLYWIGGIAIVGLTLFNTIENRAKKAGESETKISKYDDNERIWSARFETLSGVVTQFELKTNERFERMLERLNEALLTMAREHPTKNDLQLVKGEILERIEAMEFPRRPAQRKTK